jgi:hypothetical protein
MQQSNLAQCRRVARSEGCGGTSATRCRGSEAAALRLRRSSESEPGATLSTLDIISAPKSVDGPGASDGLILAR